MNLQLHKHAVVAIGNFDAVHKGHQKVLRAARKLADKYKIPAVALTFEPHPVQVFAPNADFVRLQTPIEKTQALLKAGADRVEILTFTKEFAATSPENFIKNILVGELGAKHIVVGEGFHFGHKGTGNINTLRNLEERLGYKTHAITHEKCSDGERISSTRIRALLAAGKQKEAQKLL